MVKPISGPTWRRHLRSIASISTESCGIASGSSPEANHRMLTPALRHRVIVCRRFARRDPARSKVGRSTMASWPTRKPRNPIS